MSFCQKCNNEYPDDLSSCPYCANESDAVVNENQETQTFDLKTNSDIVADPNAEFFGEGQNFSDMKPDDNNHGLSKGTLIGIIVAVVVVVAAIVIAIFCFSGNGGDEKTSGTASSEDFTMPSGYEDIINDIKDEDGNVITEATDPYGNTVTREVDDDGNVTTTFIGPDGEVSTVTTDSDGNIISYDIPAVSNSSSNTSSDNSSTTSSKNTSSNNTSSDNTSSKDTSSNNSSSSSNSSNNNSSSNNSSNSNTNNGAITINGKEYNVGDTVTFTVTVEGIMDPVAGYQFSVTYDENLLELDPDSVKYHDPGCIANDELPGQIIMSSMSAMTGFDFASTAQVFECKFTVKDSTTKSCDINFTPEEVYTGIGRNDLVDVTGQLEVNTIVE